MLGGFTAVLEEDVKERNFIWLGTGFCKHLQCVLVQYNMGLLRLLEKFRSGQRGSEWDKSDMSGEGSTVTEDACMER